MHALGRGVLRTRSHLGELTWRLWELTRLLIHKCWLGLLRVRRTGVVAMLVPGWRQHGLLLLVGGIALLYVLRVLLLVRLIRLLILWIWLLWRVVVAPLAHGCLVADWAQQVLPL